jgi:hypothetical protein
MARTSIRKEIAGWGEIRTVLFSRGWESGGRRADDSWIPDRPDKPSDDG